MSDPALSVGSVLELFRPATTPPPTTTPRAFLVWRGREQSALVLAGVGLGVINALTQAAAPYVLGRAIDDGLQHGLSTELLTWSGVLLSIWILRSFTGMLAHTVDVTAWLRACLGTVHELYAKVTGTGDAMRRAVPTGEAVATVASDGPRIAEVFAFFGRFVGSLLAYLVVAAVLMRSSTTLGLAVLLGIPIVAGVLALIVRPLQRRQAEQREQNGKLTVLGSDTVTGLRILRGIGGEEAFTQRYREQSQRVREAGVRVAGTQSLLDSMQTLIPGLFLAGVIWYGARLALSGEISPGELVAFYGYAAYLTMPLSSATQGVAILTRARIAATRVLRVLTVSPAVSPTPDGGAHLDLPAGGDLVDPASGLEVRAGSLIAVVSADPDASAALATRLGRFDDEDPAPSATLGGVPLDQARIEDVRQRVVVSEATPTLFTGVMSEELDVRGTGDRERISRAMHVADAGDVLDSVPGGLDGRIEEKGRSLSGGQRQRVSLARALMTDAEVLVLIEPTSAVDAHTEARIASRLAGERAGRTTVVVSASPLVLDQVDEVVLLTDGRVRLRGRHHELMRDAELAAHGQLGGERAEAAIAYRRIVSRSVDDSPAETPGHVTEEEDAAEPSAGDAAAARAAAAAAAAFPAVPEPRCADPDTDDCDPRSDAPQPVGGAR